MQRDVAIQKLRCAEIELRAAGIEHLRLFGSTARGNAGDDSDVDLIADLDKTRRWSLVSVGRLQVDLSDILREKVDLTVEEWLKPAVAATALGESVDVF